MKLVEMTCPHCGAVLHVASDLNQAKCDYCGTVLMIEHEEKNVPYDNAEEAGYRFEKGRQRAISEANVYDSTWNQQTVYVKKRRTWLWVLGWIFIFPVPLTILLVRNKTMNPALKFGLIAAAWIVFIALGMSGDSSSSEASASARAGNGGDACLIAVQSETGITSFTFSAAWQV